MGQGVFEFLLKSIPHHCPFFLTEQIGICKRLLDLFIVSVLLDAGAGDDWSYTWTGSEEKKTQFGRSEGLALASLDWFLSGGLSSDSNQLEQVDGERLKSLTCQDLEVAFQVNSNNPLVGVQGRCNLLNRLGHVISSGSGSAKYFTSSSPTSFRPGNLVHYLLAHVQIVNSQKIISIEFLWEVIMEGLSGVWPDTRTKLSSHGPSLGDVWPCQALTQIHAKLRKSNPKIPSTPLTYPPSLYTTCDPIMVNDPLDLAPNSDHLLAFHKLSQWLTYSLSEPLALLDFKFTHTHL